MNLKKRVRNKKIEDDSHMLMKECTKLSRSDFGRLSELITSTCGIKMPQVKITMVQGRLMRRLRHLGISSLKEYCEYLFSDEGMREELVHAIDAITTNKTDFFREPSHFEYLSDVLLPELACERKAGFRRPLRVWSAGCSTGKEPYSLAMVLSEFRRMKPDFSFTILATDISTNVLEKARIGVYDMNKAEPIPLEMRKRYLLKSRDREKGLIRIRPEIRGCVEFRHLNLMDEDYGMRQGMDIIFFRNVLIYFERPKQEAILDRLCRNLESSGSLFIGHSETLTGMDLPLRQRVPTVYRKH